MTPLDVTVRVATDADLDRLVALSDQASESIRPSRGGAAHLDVDGYGWSMAVRFAGPHRTTFIGLIDDATIGFAVVAAAGASARIEAIYVEPDAREVGVGEELLNAAIAWSQHQGCSILDAVALPGDRHTKNFFETFGMVARAITVSRSLTSD